MSTKSRGTRFDVVHDEQHLLEERADQDDQELLGVVGAGPEDGQRHERHDRHVADEVDERLERGLPEPVRADQDPIGIAIAVAITKPTVIRVTEMRMSSRAGRRLASSTHPVQTSRAALGRKIS